MMFIFNLKKCTIFAVLIVYTFIIPTIQADYTSEEIDEQSKSLYRAETSILASTENNKHQHKHSYYGSPCVSGGCPGAFSPCSNPSGCPQPNVPVLNNGIRNSVNSHVPPAPGIYTNGGYGTGYSVNSRHRNISPPPQTSYTGVSGYAPPLPYQVPSSSYGAGNIHSSSVNKPPSQQPSQIGYGGYTQPAGSVASYPHWNSHPNHYGYQGPRGYSVYDHSLKLNTEYTETGTHTGPLQRGNNGYGSGYGGGYNGLFNRPGF